MHCLLIDTYSSISKKKIPRCMLVQDPWLLKEIWQISFFFLCLIPPFSGFGQFGGTQHDNPTPHHVSADCACLPVRVADWKRRLQDPWDPRGYRSLDPSGLGNAAQFHREGRHHQRRQRGHHSVCLPHLLCHVRGKCNRWLHPSNNFVQVVVRNNNLMTYSNTWSQNPADVYEK